MNVKLLNQYGDALEKSIKMDENRQTCFGGMFVSGIAFLVFGLIGIGMDIAWLQTVAIVSLVLVILFFLVAIIFIHMENYWTFKAIELNELLVEKELSILDDVQEDESSQEKKENQMMKILSKIRHIILSQSKTVVEGVVMGFKPDVKDGVSIKKYRIRGVDGKCHFVACNTNSGFAAMEKNHAVTLVTTKSVFFTQPIKGRLKRNYQHISECTIHAEIQ